MSDETKEEQEKRLDAISKTLDALLKEHGPMMVAGAIQAMAIGNPEYMFAALRVSLMARDIVQQKRAEDAEVCQCAECRAQRAQA